MQIVGTTETVFPRYEDEHLSVALEWFLSFISAKEWNDRKTAIENLISIEFKTSRPSEIPLSEMIPISVKKDQIGWYLYLLEMLLTSMEKYEPVQGARVIPIFKRFGEYIELVKAIGGVQKKVRRLIKKNRSQADAILFEILTALLWARNGWEVNFIPETPHSKSPDILAKRSNEEWHIECKRLSKSSDYSERERIKWLKMLSFICELLIKNNILLDVVFHVELESLSDTFMKEELDGKILLRTLPGKIISNEIWDVSFSFVDIKAINKHLDSWFVKFPSPQLNYLIGGRIPHSVGFSSGTIGDLVRVGNKGGNNFYVSNILSAFGVHWYCDADRAIKAKARDVHRQMKAAFDQFQIHQNAFIHIGLETLDGPRVEMERFVKLFDTISFFDAKGKKLKWIYCHLFQSYAPPDQIWVIDETLHDFASENDRSNDPLKHKFLIAPYDDWEDDVHWLKPEP